MDFAAGAMGGQHRHGSLIVTVAHGKYPSWAVCTLLATSAEPQRPGAGRAAR